MIVLVEATARAGKTTSCNKLRYFLSGGALVFDEPKFYTQKQIDEFFDFCERYSKIGNIVIADDGNLIYQTNQKILDVADLVLTTRLHDRNAALHLGLNTSEINFGEFFIVKTNSDIAPQLALKISTFLNFEPQKI